MDKRLVRMDSNDILCYDWPEAWPDGRERPLISKGITLEGWKDYVRDSNVLLADSSAFRYPDNDNVVVVVDSWGVSVCSEETQPKPRKFVLGAMFYEWPEKEGAIKEAHEVLELYDKGELTIQVLLERGYEGC